MERDNHTDRLWSEITDEQGNDKLTYSLTNKIV